MRTQDRPYQLVSDFSPTGDQPQAIEGLVRRLEQEGRDCACLLGATGTGKTFTMANVIERLRRPALIISHNKTLAAQLYEEMRELFPNNAVCYFVSYYDYYQPEAYIPQRDIYIEKDASRNDDLDRLRLAATSNLLSRSDVIVVASVSCIFGLGSPDEYRKKVLAITKGSRFDRRQFFLALNEMQYQRKDMDLERGCYRARGDTIEIHPAYEQFAVRVETFGDGIDRVELIHPTTGETLSETSQFLLFPAVHYVMPEDAVDSALVSIREEMQVRVKQLQEQGKLLEAQRLLARTRYDLEMIEEVGYCSGIENYSRHLESRAPGERPSTLLDYFFRSIGAGAVVNPEQAKRDWLLIIDESHVTLPQIRAMYNGDQRRKEVLIEHVFRLPSALDNRPLQFEEFEALAPQTVYVSATPAPYELDRVGGDIVEQIIRPTGLLDPAIELRPARGQVVDLIDRCKAAVAAGERVLVIALTKRLCEQLTDHLDSEGLRVRYLHSDIETLDRIEILRDLREGVFDVLVGVNLLREGLDLPEVALVCILDADKEGFLRSATSLIQQMGRAARNVNATVVMYADKVTPAMQQAIDETERRRELQLAHNRKHNITPTQIQKAIRRGIEIELQAQKRAREALGASEQQYEKAELLRMLEDEMFAAAEVLEFEKAARLRDQVKSLKARGTLGDRIRRSDLERTSANSTSAQSEKPGAPGARRGKRRKPGRGR